MKVRAPNPLAEVNSIDNPFQLPLEAERRIFSRALTSRRVDEKLLEFFSQGKIFGTIHTCVGQEMTGAVLAEWIQPKDSIFSNHRCHGHFLSTRGTPEELIAELMGKKTGVCGGRGGSQHLCKQGFYSNGIQGGIVPVATGIALGKKLKNAGALSFVFIGDGTLGEGAVYESLNIAAKWNLPLFIVLEDNGYSQSTRQDEILAGGILERAQAFGIRSEQGSTWEWKALWKKAGELTEWARAEQKPVFLRINTARLKAHSKGDDNRSQDEVQKLWDIDPLNFLLASSREDLNQIALEIDLEVNQASSRAEAAAFAQIRCQTPSYPAIQWKSHRPGRRRLVTAINEVFHEIMAADTKTLFIGEDVLSPYGGAFKVSAGLSDQFPGRVRNTPISESAIAGIGSGLALEGFRPFIEIMFGDFLMLASDQIVNHAAKFQFMYNEQVEVNTILRTPMGGRRAYGPTHSQCLEKHFLGVPGLRVLALTNLVEPGLIYRALLSEKLGPVLLIENKALYGTFLRDQLPDGFELLVSDEKFPSIYVKPNAEKVDYTLLGYGGVCEILVQAVDKIFQEHDLIGQIVCPTQLYPWKAKPLFDAIAPSNALIIVEEGQGFAGFGAEAIAQIAEVSPFLSGCVRRVTPLEVPIPASEPMETSALPGLNQIIEAVVSAFKRE